VDAEGATVLGVRLNREEMVALRAAMLRALDLGWMMDQGARCRAAWGAAVAARTAEGWMHLDQGKPTEKLVDVAPGGTVGRYVKAGDPFCNFLPETGPHSWLLSPLPCRLYGGRTAHLAPATGYLACACGENLRGATILPADHKLPWCSAIRTKLAQELAQETTP